MSRTTKRRLKKIGLPSESLVYTGDQSGRTISITIIDYNEQAFEERQVQSADECLPYRAKPTATWINIDGVHDSVLLEKLGEGFGLHRLVTEDILSVVQRPKVEDYGDYLFIVFKMLTYDDRSGYVVPEQVSLVVGENFLLSFQEDVKGDVFGMIRDRLRVGRGKIRKMGVDYLAYSLLDAVVDNYFAVLEKFGEQIDLAEKELIERPTDRTHQTIYRLKRELLLLHKSVWPVRELVAALLRIESPLVRESTMPYFRDIYDHAIQAIDTIEIYREMLSEMISIYLSSVSNKLNAVMKVLTIIATIFMPLTFIAGVYGMNFKYMPELEWHWGYPLVLFGMAGISAVMIYYFRKKKWM